MYSIGERYATSRSSHGIHLFQQSKTAPFTDAEVRIRLLPGAEGLLGDAVLPAQIADRSVLSGLTEGIGNLFFGERSLLHRSAPFVGDRRSCLST
jgi:hypothetical protein